MGFAKFRIDLGQPSKKKCAHGQPHQKFNSHPDAKPTWTGHQKKGETAKLPFRYSVSFVSGYWHSGVEWGGVLSITKSSGSSNFGTQILLSECH